MSDDILVIIGAVASIAVIETLSRAAALPGVTPVPGKETNRISKVLPTVADVVGEIESETKEP